MSQYTALFEELTGVDLQPGENYIICPLHAGDHKNFAINTIKGVWICHRGCGEGNAWQLASAVLGLSPLRAVDYVEQFERGYVGPDSVSELLAALRGTAEEENQPFERDWSRLTTEQWPRWWRQRGFDDTDWRRWQAAMDTSTGDAVLPVYDLAGQCVGEVRRRLPGVEPKYLYSAGFHKSRALFGSWLFPNALRSDVVLVEGPLDAAWCWKYGWPALGLFGSRVSAEQISILRALRVERVTLALDNDPPGREAAARALRKLAGGFECRIVDWTDEPAKDVQELPENRLHCLLSETVAAQLYQIGVR